MKAVLIQSQERFESFRNKLEEHGVDYVVLAFEDQEWIDFDYSTVDFLVFYSSFEFSSHHPLALYKAYDNLMHVHRSYPDLPIYPDPGLIYFYNDKYRQHLFLKTHGFPIPQTIPLLSEKSVELAHQRLGYPMVVKNRYGAGGGAVFLIRSRAELESYYKLSRLDFVHRGTVSYLFHMLKKRMFYYNLLKERKMTYPFLSPPLLAQEYITTDRDLKTVVGDGKVVEGHWRLQASADEWKVNIDGGGIGQWSSIPGDALELSERLASELSAGWINLDLMPAQTGFLISEFSPVWHHYAYREKPTFVYKDDYNIDPPLAVSLDLEGMIVGSLMKRREMTRQPPCRVI